MLVINDIEKFNKNMGICHKCDLHRADNVCGADPEERDFPSLANEGKCPNESFSDEPLNKDASADRILKILMSPVHRILPADWHEWPGAKDAHQKLTEEFASTYSSAQILHVYHNVQGIDDTRNDHARTTWGGEGVTLLPFTPIRTSADIGDARALPYINDLLDYACLQAGDDTIVVWSNLDNCLTPDAYQRIRAALAWQDVCFARRVDTDDATAGPPDMTDTSFQGCDLLAFRPCWWRQVRHDVPEMFLANTQFDTVLRMLAARDSPVPEFFPRIIYHERHGESWWQTNASTPSGIHNRREWESWWSLRWEAYNKSGKIKHLSPPKPRVDKSKLGGLRVLLRKFPRRMISWDGSLAEFKPPLVIAETGHHGDLLYLIPALKWLYEHGHQVIYACKEEYQESIEDLDWVKCVDLDQASSFGDVLTPGKGGSWAEASWARTGVPLELRHTLPLVLENRRPDAEAEVVSALVRPGKPLILFSGAGHSSPFPDSVKVRDHLLERFKGCQLIDLGQIKTDRLRDLCGLLDVADVLVTIDTATLHLSYATNTPTIALLPDSKWKASEPRRHWKMSMTYDQSITPEGLAAIDEAIGEILVGNRKPVSFAERLGHGALGLGKALMGLGGAEKKMVEMRAKVCRECDHRGNLVGLVPGCKLCGCVLEAKIRNADEVCPQGKW